MYKARMKLRHNKPTPKTTRKSKRPNTTTEELEE